MIESPKQRLLKSKKLTEAIANMTETAEFAIAADAALLEVIRAQPETNDPVMAAAAYHRIEGAKLFSWILHNIAIQPKQPAVRVTGDNLNQNTH